MTTATPTPQEPTPETPATEVGSNSEAKLAEVEARLAEMSDAYLRAKAEVENIRRRSEEEMSKARKFAVESFAESHVAGEGQHGSPPWPTARRPGGKSARRRASHASASWHAARSTATRCWKSTRPWAPSLIRTSIKPFQHGARRARPQHRGDGACKKATLIADRVLRPALVMVAARRSKALAHNRSTNAAHATTARNDAGSPLETPPASRT